MIFYTYRLLLSLFIKRPICRRLYIFFLEIYSLFQCRNSWRYTCITVLFCDIIIIYGLCLRLCQILPTLICHCTLSVVLLFPRATLCICQLGLLLHADDGRLMALPCASYLLLLRFDNDAAGTDPSSRAAGSHSPAHSDSPVAPKWPPAVLRPSFTSWGVVLYTLDLFPSGLWSCTCFSPFGVISTRHMVR